MDLQRIKQNLRLHSGRARKNARREEKNQNQAQSQSQTQSQSTSHPSRQLQSRSPPQNVSQDPPQPLRSHPSGHLTALPSFDPKDNDRSSAAQRSKESNGGKFQTRQQNAERSKAGQNPDTSSFQLERPGEPPRRKSTRYGRSGIEIPMSGYSSESLSASNPMPKSRLSHIQSQEMLNFDLPVPSKGTIVEQPSIEKQSELLFSGQHLESILHSTSLLPRFTAFLHKFLPTQFSILIRYLETQKALKAVAYANAVIEGLPPLYGKNDTSYEFQLPRLAASLDDAFEKYCKSAFENLVDTALPLYLTFSLVKNVSELLTTAITGKATPITTELVDGLSEVFCLTDPTQEDNPIIYASEEFFRLTRYSRNDVISYNCRFLQGPRTKQESVKRLAAAIKNGEEICETLLNYRRDGRPFINLLMIAPLHDDKGKLKYFLGAQLDVSGMIDGGRGLESFQRCLVKAEAVSHDDQPLLEHNDNEDGVVHRGRTLSRLRELSEMFDLEESAVVQANSRPSSAGHESERRSSQSIERPKGARRTYAETEESEVDDEEERQTHGNASAWRLSQAGPDRLSGKLPGFYETFMLIRPAPSLRIVFVSPKLRKFGSIIQSPFLSHVAAAQGTLLGLRTSLMDGTPVTAKISFMPERGEERYGTKLPPGMKDSRGTYGRACWISCTPLKRADEMIGVWMVVFVDESRAKIAAIQAPALQNSAEPSRLVEHKPGEEKVNGMRSPPSEDHAFEETGVSRERSISNGHKSDRSLGAADNETSIMHTPIEPSYIRHQTDALPVQDRHETNRPYQHIATNQSPPLPRQNSDSENTSRSSDDEFVQTRPQQASPTPNERVVIRPDSEIGPENSSQIADSGQASSTQGDGIRSVPYLSAAPESPRSVPSDAQFADESEMADLESPSDLRQEEEDAKRNAARDDETQYDNSHHSFQNASGEMYAVHGDSSEPQHEADLDRREQNTEAAEQTVENSSSSPRLGRKDTNSTERPVSPSSNYKSNAMRLEYVMLPNGRQSTEYNRGMTGSWQVRSKEGSESENTTEGECARSPYSVD